MVFRASFRLAVLAAFSFTSLVMIAPLEQAAAQPGTNLATIIAKRPGTQCASTNPQGNHSGVGVGIAFDGSRLLISCSGDNTIAAVDPLTGNLLAIYQVNKASSLGALAWDNTRGLLWACSGGNVVGMIALTSANPPFITGSSFSTGGCYDGLAYDGSDDTIWVSGDAAFKIQHYKINGVLISQTNIGGLLGGSGNSGIAVGGSKLYLANNGGSQIYKAPKSLATASLFSSFPRRLEDEECDNLTFAKPVIWTIDAYDNVLTAWELSTDPADSCTFGGGTPTVKVCKIAGPGIDIGTPFDFNVGASQVTVPAGPDPKGYCKVVKGAFSAGAVINVQEVIPPNDQVTSINVAPANRLVSGSVNLVGGSVQVTVGPGVTTVTFRDKGPGYIEVCKETTGHLAGDFVFTIKPPSPAPAQTITVPAGACSGSILVASGAVRVTETVPNGVTLVGCTSIPNGTLIQNCSGPNHTAVVTVYSGDVSVETILTFTNHG